jgi:hypothetical protein
VPPPSWLIVHRFRGCYLHLLSWYRGADHTLLLVLVTGLFVFGFTSYVIAKMWVEWRWPLRLVATGGLLVLVVLGWTTAGKFSDAAFRAAFLANYVVAVGLFVLTFFVVEQFLDARRGRLASARYLPAIAEELLRNSRNLARNLALVKQITYLGYEASLPTGSPDFRLSTGSWSSLLESGHFAALPRQRSQPFGDPIALLSQMDRRIAARTFLSTGEGVDYSRVLAWSDSFPSDLERCHEVLRDVRGLFEALSLKTISPAAVGLAGTPRLHQPQGEQEGRLANAYKLAVEFCERGTATLVFCCFVLWEVFLVQGCGGEATRYSSESADEVLRKVLASVPPDLRRPPNRCG